MAQEQLEFFLSMEPPTITDQEHRIGFRHDGKPYIYKPRELMEARTKLAEALAKHIPKQKYDGPLRLTVKWLFPTKKHRHGEWKITKPDTDNLNKMLKDVMTALGFWTDDAQVCSEIIEKFWSTVPGIYIKVEALEDD